MADKPSSRKIELNLCVLFTDVVGSRRLYSVLGDARALEAIKMQEQICARAVAERGGAVVKTGGDSVMARFTDVPSAVAAALRFQVEIGVYNREPLFNTPLAVRVGLHCGQGLSEEADVYGQVVNVAAHVSKLAGPGAVFVSRDVHERMPPEERAVFRYGGPEMFKGVEHIVEIWHAGMPTVSETSGTRLMDVYDNPPLDDCVRAPAFRVRAAIDGQPPKEIVVGEKPVTLGKAARCDFSFAADGYLSRVHAYLAVVGGILWIFDNESKAGILLEDPELAPGRQLVLRRRGPLQPGQTAVLSTVRLTAEPLPP